MSQILTVLMFKLKYKWTYFVLNGPENSNRKLIINLYTVSICDIRSSEKRLSRFWKIWSIWHIYLCFIFKQFYTIMAVFLVYLSAWYLPKTNKIFFCKNISNNYDRGYFRFYAIDFCSLWTKTLIYESKTWYRIVNLRSVFT